MKQRIIRDTLSWPNGWAKRLLAAKTQQQTAEVVLTRLATVRLSSHYGNHRCSTTHGPGLRDA